MFCRGASRVDSYTNSVPSPQAVASRLGPPPEEALEFAADHHYTQNLSLSRAQLAKRVHELVAALEAERLAPAFDVAYCVVGQVIMLMSPSSLIQELCQIILGFIAIDS